MRGWTSAVSCPATNWFVTRMPSRIDHGVSHSDAAAVIRNPKKAQVRIGHATLRAETPAARIAVISPSEDMRLRAISVPVRMPNGIEYGRACGSTSANRYPTVEPEPELRTRNSKRRAERCMKTINVKSAEPMIALAATSQKTIRLSRRIVYGAEGGETIGAFGNCSRGVSNSISSKSSAGEMMEVGER